MSPKEFGCFRNDSEVSGSFRKHLARSETSLEDASRAVGSLPERGPGCNRRGAGDQTLVPGRQVGGVLGKVKAAADVQGDGGEEGEVGERQGVSGQVRTLQQHYIDFQMQLKYDYSFVSLYEYHSFILF